MWQRTPNYACPMNQVFLTKDEQEKIRDALGERFAERNNYYNGFLYQWRDNLTYDHSDTEREEFYWMLWKMVSLSYPSTGCFANRNAGRLPFSDEQLLRHDAQLDREPRGVHILAGSCQRTRQGSKKGGTSRSYRKAPSFWWQTSVPRAGLL